MTKQELIAALNQEATSHYDAGVSKVVIEAVLDSLTEVVVEELKKGGEITMPGIGKLTVHARAARMGRNPATGESIKIKGKNVPKFSAAKALKDAVA